MTDIQNIDNNDDAKTGCWEDIISSQQVLESIKNMGFKSPTPIQRAIIPEATKLNKDVIGAAETGSGKTLSFAIPIMEKWLADGRQNLPKDEVKLFAVIIAPTRELAIQITNVLKQLSIKTSPRGMHTISIVGGMSEQKQQRLLKTRPDVIVATPGRLWALKQMGEEHLDDLSGMEMLVVDEIDRMLEQGHFEELKHIVHDIHRNIKMQQLDGKFQLQTLIFSATLTFTHHIPIKKGEKSTNVQQHSTIVDPKQKVRRIAQSMWMRKGANKLAVVDLTSTQKTPKTLIECRMNCDDLLQKDTNLFYLLRRYGGRTLIFGNSVSAIRRLQALLRKLTPPNGPFPRILHGRMKEKERLKNLERFEASKNSILLATDVAARGLDFHSVQNIIHYQTPKTTENYIHRSGRTARASKTGLSVLFVDPLNLHNYQKICRNMNREEDLELLAVDDEKLLINCKKMVELGTELESLEHRMKKRKSREEWFRQMAEKADLIWEEDEEEKDRQDEPEEEEEGQKMRRRKKAVERALKEMMKNWTNEEKKNREEEEKEMEEEENGPIRKRLKLEKGVKKWFKRPKLESIASK